MDPECYQVEVLHYLNPHLIWVEVIQPHCNPSNSHGGFVFEQIGVYGILPLECTIDIEEECLKTQKGLNWEPGVAQIMAQIIEDASEVWFSPTHIDRRTSIFDSNIHKYGEIFIKAKCGQLKQLSKMLIKTCFAYCDECEFHKELCNFNLKTKLDNLQTCQVILALEKCCTKMEKPKSHWNSSIGRHTSVFRNEQIFEASLTRANLELHNRRNEILTGSNDLKEVMKKKSQDFKLCRDVDEESNGCGILSPRKKSKDKISIGDTKVEQPKEKQSSNNNLREKSAKNVDAFPFFNETKNMILQMAKNRKDINIKGDDNEMTADENLNVPTFEPDHTKKSMLEEDQVIQRTERNEADISIEDDALPCYSKINPAKVSTSNDKEFDNRDKTEYYSKQQSQVTNVVNHTPKKPTKKVSKKSPKIPDYDIDKEVRIAYGPPDIDPAKLTYKVVKKLLTEDEIEDKEMEDNLKYEEPEKDDNILAGLDSEVNFPISSNKSPTTKSQYLPKSNDDSQTQADENTKDTNIGFSSPTRNTPTTKSVSGLLQKKLRVHKLLNIVDNSPSTSDTSQKDSSSEEVKSSKISPGKNMAEVDSDDETTLSSIIKKLNLDEKSNEKLSEETAPTEIPTPCFDRNHVNPFKNLGPSLSKFVEKLVTAVIMVHAKQNQRIQPVCDLRDVSFSPKIKSVLTDMSIKSPKQLQTISWFSILRGYSVFMVSPVASGKTLGYIPAVCRLVSDYDVNEVPDSLGPICIIVCATSSSVCQVEWQCRRFLGQDKSVVACYAGIDERKTRMALLNGCDIFVCTPSTLVRLLTVQDFGIDLKRLATFVLDDCERLNEVYVNEVKVALMKIKEMVKNRANKELTVQYIIASRIWCDFMEPLARKTPKSLICIGAFQECVLYSKTNMTVKYVSKENRVNSVVRFMNNVDKSKKTVIVCRLDEEADLIGTALVKLNYRVFATNNNMTVEKLSDLSMQWADYEDPITGAVLVCCDGNLTHLNITDAHNLLHVSLPSMYSMFAKRFAVLVDNYPSIFKEENENLKIEVFLEDTNVEQLPKILNFIKRCTGEVPAPLTAICEKVLADKDLVKARSFVPICDNMLSLGECPDFWNCQERHTLFQSHDVPEDWVPKAGTVTFRILHHRTAVTYSARLLTNTTNGKSIKYPNSYDTLSWKMGVYFSKESNKMLHGVPKLGDICAVKIKQNFYRRCQVIKILNEYETTGNPKFVLVNLIDEEKWEKTQDIYLYHLPKELKDMNSHVVKVKLANVQPKDKDVTFSDLARDQLKKLTDNDNIYLRGEIVMTVGNVIIVENLEACQDRSSMREPVVRYNFIEELKSHAMANPDHIEKLRKLCEINGVKLHTVNEDGNDRLEQKTAVKELPKPQWAHLESDRMHLIYFASAKNPDKFFIRLEKFEDFLDFLTKDIQKYIEEDKPKPLTSINKYDIVLAKFPDDSLYYRARIDHILDGNKVKCFFVDHGDWREVQSKDLIPMTEKFITQLPFQAIECRLVGIKPGGTAWTEFSTNWFFDQCVENSTNDLKELYAKYFTKEIAECTDGHKYGIAIIDTTTEYDVVINRAMIDHGMAREDLDEIAYLDDLDFKRKEKVSSDLEEDDWEKCVEKTEISKNDSNNDIKQRDAVSLLLTQPTRSVPLVGSDSSDGEWDCEFSPRTISEIFKCNVGSKEIQQQPNAVHKTLPAIKPKNPLDSEKFKNIDNLVKSSHKVAKVNELDTQNKEKDFEKVEEASTVTTNSSKLSGFEMVQSSRPLIQELDSDDFSSPENTKLNEKVPLHVEEYSTNLRKPKLVWRQQKTNVSIRIELIGVEEYELEIKERSIKFETTVHDTDYGFELDLYGVVDPKKSMHSPRGLYIYVKLTKLLNKNWLSLTRDERVNKWIVYDPDSIDLSSDEEDNLVMNQDHLKMIEETHYNCSDDDDDENDYRDDVNFKHKYRRDSD